jgi:hypothetical protein
VTECNQEVFSFAAHFSRRVEASFTAEAVLFQDTGLIRVSLGRTALLAAKTFPLKSSGVDVFVLLQSRKIELTVPYAAI